LNPGHSNSLERWRAVTRNKPDHRQACIHQQSGCSHH